MSRVIKAIWHTLRFMWVGRFGGVIDGGEYYLLRPIKIHKNAQVELLNLTINKLHKKELFIVALSGNHHTQFTNTKWVFKDD